MKSNVSDHLELVAAVYIDATAKCVADVSDLRDLDTIRSRVENEGVSFLTITLPDFCKDFERSLATGRIDSTCFRSFRKYGSIPVFLRGMISQIFDRETGRINDDSSNLRDFSSIVEAVRQICLLFKKLELPCSPIRVDKAIANYTAIEQSFQMFSVSADDVDEFRRTSAVLWDNDMANIRLDQLVPRHGPGATAERVSGNQKYDWGIWHDRLEPYFPLVDNAYSMSVSQSDLEKVTIVNQEQEQPVRVTPVPKTLKGPRIIAIEPACMQYTQQAIREALYERLESSELTKGHVNFTDQSVNQMLALDASKTGLLATIDLSDASDRVPLSLSLEMFRANPDLQGAIEACRSTRAELPNGQVIGPLQKFASMGSALCFPVESMYFYTICVAALLKSQNLPVSFANVLKVSRNVYVYGDDIIVPSTNATIVLDYLQKYNCKVNSSKSFWTGKFRESCGTDAYDGVEVTPTYLRKERPKNKRQVSEIISWVSTSNLFYLRGYWRTASLMRTACEKIIGPLPYVSRDSPGLGRISFLGYRSVERWNGKLHRFEVRAMVPRPVYRSDSIDGYPALQKSLLRLRVIKHEGVGDALHMERSALYGAVALKRRWVPAS